jgi:hypothetical protein
MLAVIPSIITGYVQPQRRYPVTWTASATISTSPQGTLQAAPDMQLLSNGIIPFLEI